ncbi:MAG: hypothetical protein U0V73_16055 [Acidimicrobiia bacterium]
MATASDLHRAALALRHTSRALDTAFDRSRRLLSRDTWRGRAADRARDEIELLRAAVHTVARSLDATAAQLEREAAAASAAVTSTPGDATGAAR